MTILKKLLTNTTYDHVPFNKRPNGDSYLAVEIDGTPEDTVIVWEKKELQTSVVSSSVIIGHVPERLYSTPGQYSICLLCKSTYERSNSLVFSVNPFDSKNYYWLVDRWIKIINYSKVVLSYAENIESSNEPIAKEIAGSGLKSALAAIVETQSINGSEINYEELHMAFRQFVMEDIDNEAKLHEWGTKIIGLEKLIITIGNSLFIKLRHEKNREKRDSLLSFLRRYIRRYKIKDEKFINSNLAILNACLGKTTVNAYPVEAIVDTNNTCNFKCKMCFAHGSNTTLLNCNFTLFDNTRNLLKHARNVILAGTGEPLLYPYMGYFSQLLSDYGIKTDTTTITNGSLLEKRAQNFSYIAKVSVSFDGANKRTFEGLRTGANFDNIVNNITVFKKQYPKKKLILGVTVSRLNIDELADIAQIAVKLNVDEINMAPITVMDPFQFLELKGSDYAIFEKQLHEIEVIQKASKIKIVNNLVKAHFITVNDSVRNKDLLYESLEKLETSKASLLKLGELADKSKELQKFEAWPERFFANDRLNLISKNHHDTVCPSVCSSACPGEKKELRKLKYELVCKRNQPGQKFQLPHCLAPWTLTYINSDGMVRACCLHKLDISIIGKEFFDVWNDPVYRQLRESFLYQRDLPEACKTCQDSFRYNRYKELIDYMVSHFGIDPAAIVYPINFDKHRI